MPEERVVVKYQLTINSKDPFVACFKNGINFKQLGIASCESLINAIQEFLHVLQCISHKTQVESYIPGLERLKSGDRRNFLVKISPEFSLLLVQCPYLLREYIIRYLLVLLFKRMLM